MLTKKTRDYLLPRVISSTLFNPLSFMKKFFRMVSMFVLAGATLAYTGCTDYDEDIEAINDRIDALETGKLKTVEEQISSLSASVTDLQAAKAKTESAIEALQSALSALQTKHAADIKALEEAYKKADDDLKTSIQNQIKTLTDQFNAKVTEINTAISGLQSSVNGINTKISGIEATIKTLASKEYVDATFATKEEVKKVEEELGKLSARLEIAEKAISTIKGQISDLQEADKKLDEAVKAAQKAADDAQTAADKAQGTADAALGTVNALVEALGAYSVQGALEAKIAALVEMDEELDEKKFNTADFHDTFTKEFDAAIAAALKNGGVINKEIASQVAAAKKTLDDKIDAVEKALNARIDKVLGIIEGRLTSIAFVPQYYYEGVPAILFETIAYDALKDGKDNENAVPVAKELGDEASNAANQYKYFATALATAKYRLNPRTVGIDCADFSFVGDQAEYIYSTRATAPAAPISVSGTPSYDPKTGYVTFQVKKDEKLNTTAGKFDIVALKALLKKGLTDDEKKAEAKPEVYSEYAFVNEVTVPSTVLALADKALLTKAALPAGYVRGKFSYTNGHEYANTFKAATEGDVVYEMPYNKNFDLKALVSTCYSAGNDGHKVLDLEKYGFTYKFSKAQSDYIIKSEDTQTNQQTVIECVDAEKGIFKTIDAQGVENNKEAIGRTPIVRVDLMHGKNIVARAFIKLLISVEKEKDFTVYDEVQNKVLSCPDTKIERVISEEVMRDAVYRRMNISHEEFWNIYGNPSTDIKVIVADKNNKYTPGLLPAPALIDGVDSDGKATKKVTWSLTHRDIGGLIQNGVKVIATLTVHNKLASSERPAAITFQFEVNLSLPEPEVKAVEKALFWKDGVLQANVNRPNSTTDVADNCWFNTPIQYQPWEELSVKKLPCKETPAFRIVKVIANGVQFGPTNAPGVTLSTYNNEVSIALAKTDFVKNALNSEKGLQAVVEWYAKSASGDEFSLHTFTVNFIRPLNFSLPEGLEVTDATTGGDVIDFNDPAMLTDWRNELVYAPSSEFETRVNKYWVKVCGENHGYYIPTYTVEVEPAKYIPVTEEIEIAAGATVFTASYQLYENAELIAWYKEHGDRNRYFDWDELKYVYRPEGTWVKAAVVTGQGQSENEAEKVARAKVNQKNSHYLDGRTSCGMDYKYLGCEYETSKGTKITVVVDYQYIPAKVETRGGEWKTSPCSEKPESTDYPLGTTIGCYQLFGNEYLESVKVEGQYWEFYGPISAVALDLSNNYKNVKTNLPNGKLPTGAVLKQDGTTLRYENVLSPIQHSYEIYIPATITYGWGKLTDTLVIKVNPVGTIAQ